jgi:hypothetical protein
MSNEERAAPAQRHPLACLPFVRMVYGYLQLSRQAAGRNEGEARYALGGYAVVEDKKPPRRTKEEKKR